MNSLKNFKQAILLNAQSWELFSTEQTADFRTNLKAGSQPDPTSLEPDSEEELSSFVTQEIRTSVTPIQATLSLLRHGQLDPLSQAGQRLLAIATSNVGRLLRLTESIESEPVSYANILSDAEIDRLKLKTELEVAWNHQAFQIVYQPIISLTTGKITGFEALVRWQHPCRGNIPPSDFIPLAEETGLIHSLGLWILTQACNQLQIWQQLFLTNPPLTMSVNLSPLQLLEAGFVQQIQQILEKTDIASGSLQLEITESCLIENNEAAIAVLSELQTLGIQFDIDDFGTGYSSLSRLQDLPINILKIDRSFIQGKKWDVIRLILSLAAVLGLEVIAEGVETAEELASLKILGCKQIQGYFFSKPVNSQAASVLLKKNASSSIG
jgi:EAL domain-containing protein (putative c-di-GMP-specific phosphodiesterase class I)